MSAPFAFAGVERAGSIKAHEQANVKRVTGMAVREALFPLHYHHIAKGPKEKDPLCDQELDNIAAWVKEQLRS
jgi:hypothetical protein